MHFRLRMCHSELFRLFRLKHYNIHYCSLDNLKTGTLEHFQTFCEEIIYGGRGKILIENIFIGFILAEYPITVRPVIV